ncbi:MAG: T9SS type A sorting domain-containing protein, partial [Bacteroidales bacterium]|nr:T9SS type A sorting domain-containing protein [Bacteroidales bacterium]
QFVIGFSAEEKLDVTIYNITGSKVYTNSQLLPGQTIDISSQPAGTYIVRIRHNSGVIREMIQKL